MQYCLGHVIHNPIFIENNITLQCSADLRQGKSYNLCKINTLAGIHLFKLNKFQENNTLKDTLNSLNASITKEMQETITKGPIKIKDNHTKK